MRPPTRHAISCGCMALLFLAAVLVPPMPRTNGRDAGRRPRIDLGPPGHNCRFWGLVGHNYRPEILEDQLRGTGLATLRTLGGVNRDGWGFVSYPSDSAMRRILGGPVVRRGRPPANEPADPNYDVACDEILRMRPRAVLGHVRVGTSGHFGVPDPHPFLYRGFAFAHNGDVNIDRLNGLIEGEDPTFLDRNPPEYVSGNIDSEIFFLWLMCHRQRYPEVSTSEALREAVALLKPQAAGARLNFVLTRGDTLYALRCSGYDTGDPVQYYPNDVPASPLWIVASQAMGTEGGRWGEIPPNTLAILIPGEEPSFLPVDPQGPPVFLFRKIRVRGTDRDGDGRVSSFTVTGLPDVDYGAHQVRLRVHRRLEGEAVELARSEPALLSAGGGDSLTAAVRILPAEHPAEVWNLRVDLIPSTAPEEPLAVAEPEAHPSWGLSGLMVEGSAYDSTDVPAPAISPWIGDPRPNPSTGEFEIPVRLRRGSMNLVMEIHNLQGALVFREARRLSPDVQGVVTWSGRDLHNRRVPAGVYFCRLRTGEQEEERRLTVVR